MSSEKIHAYPQLKQVIAKDDKGMHGWHTTLK